MTRQQATAVLGRLVVVLLVLGLLIVGARASSGTQPMVVHAEFARAGLNVQPGYEVRVRNVPVGRVRSIEIDRRDFSARYDLALDPGARVARDTSAHLVPKTLFGDKYLALDPAAPGAPALRSGDTITRAHTEPATEVQDVIDKAVPLLKAVHPEQFGATLSALGQAFDGTGDDLRRMMEGWTPVLDEVSSHEGDLGVVLDHVPGVAGTVAERSNDLVTAATTLGDVADVLGRDEPALGTMLRENAQLAALAGDLLANQRAKLGRIVPDLVDVVAATTAQPGQIAKFARTLRFNIRGVAEIMKTGWIKTRVSSTVIINAGTIADAPPPYGETDGSNGITPDVYVHGLPNRNITIPPDPSGSSMGLGLLFAGLGGGS
ncbi:MAG: phospholipid/cholesterol/gamma-HCH transport system substrate-binding protein [Actinomycetota bacterium]|jgi:virulence factor Mce-like protein